MTLRKAKFLMKPRPLSFTIWARAADDDPVDLGLGRTVGSTTFAEETLADNLSHLRGKLLVTL